MSSGTNALKALRDELWHAMGTDNPEDERTLRVVLFAVEKAIKGCEDQDYYDYMGEDM